MLIFVLRSLQSEITPSSHACIRKTSIFIFMESMVVSDEKIAEIVVVIIIIINIAAMKVKVKSWRKIAMAVVE